MKLCRKCGIEKSLTEFYKQSDTRDGLSTRCKECNKLYNKAAWQRRKASPNFPEYYEKWKAKYNSPEYVKSKYDRTKEVTQKRKQAKRMRVYEAYGGAKCACCGEAEFIFLTIDHINNDGAEHRKSINHIYDWLERNNYPEGFQVLCRNCNWGKHANKGVCPHKESSG